MSDLESVIKDSIDDAISEPEVVESVDVSSELEDSSPVEVQESTEAEPAEPTESLEVSSPAAKAEVEAKPVDDEFAKKHGLQQPQPGQRENRLPYSRVKKIVENAEAKAVAPFQAKVAEFETKVKDYEGRLESVGKFEQMMLNDHVGFLKLLVEKIPGYAQVFEQIAAPAAQVAPETTPVVDDDPMPQPNAKQPDGSMAYDMKGLSDLNAWNRRQARKETLAEVDQKYGKFVQKQQEEAQVRERYEAMVPVIQRQIETARTWPHFKENEDAITEALAQNPTMSLEGAYGQVLANKVLPSFQTNKETMEKEIRERTRKEVIADLKKAPSTAAPASGVKPRPAQIGGNRSLEEIIKEQVDAAGLR